MIELVLSLGIICAVVLLGFAALIFLKQKMDKELLKDLLKMQMQIQKAYRQSELCVETVSKTYNEARKEQDMVMELLTKILEETTEAKVAAQTIVKEYEINGVPLGYERNFDTIEGM